MAPKNTRPTSNPNPTLAGSNPAVYNQPNIQQNHQQIYPQQPQSAYPQNLGTFNPANIRPQTHYPPTNFGGSVNPATKGMNLATEMQQNSQVKGSYGNWGQKPTTGQTPNSTTQNIATKQNPLPAPVRPIGMPQSTGMIPTNFTSANPTLKPKQPKQNNLFNMLFAPTRGASSTRSRPIKIDPNSREYLQNLTPSQLRQEVIKTEVEIQKTLIETEKAYRQGVSTIRDLISPSSVNISVSQIEIGTKIIRSFFVLTYPRVINSGWLEGVVNVDIPMDISIFIYPQDNDEVLRELRGKVGKIQASLNLNYERGSARDPALETAYRDVEGLRDAIQQGVERFFRVGVYFTVYADSKEEMEKNSQTIESILAQQSIIMKRSALQMDSGFNASLPILKDDLYVFNNMNTSPLSASFPFVSSDLSSNTGILYGINRQNSSLILFDRFELENANSLVFATSGAGKSYTVKLEILRSMMMGINVIVIDPENEYKFLSDAVGGTYLNVSLNSNNRINPFDLPKSLPGESNGDILRSAMIDLMGLMNLMLGKLNPQEEGLMERALNECYAKRDINANSDFSKITPPTMGDLVEILNGIVGGESLAQRLYRYTEGTFSGIFNQPTNLNMDNQLIIFNIRDLQDALRPIAMYIILKYVWNEIRSELRRRILAVDEAWILMQNEDSAKFLFGLAKRARKYYLGLTTITQDVNDFLNSPYGKPIVTNAAMKVLLKQSTAAIDLVGETFALTDGEKQVLLQSGVGQGIFFAGPRHVAIQIVAFPTEHRIVTSNPKEILAMRTDNQAVEQGN
jgi:conjugal transfer ATP-binding protein TraC